MSTLLSRVRYLSKMVKTNQVFSLKQHFHSNPCLLNEPSFTEKPVWLQKFKLKQVALQKEDGRPTFLKKGFVDKVLYNFTLGLLLYCMFLSYKVLEELEAPKKQE